jgi:hypothetical protein
MTHLDVLARVVKQLTAGDWREPMLTLRRPDAASDPTEVVRLRTCLREVARCQRFQCASGDVVAARSRADKAAEILSGYPHNRPKLHDEPAPERQLPWLNWATTRVVLRDLGELDAVQRIFVDLNSGRDELKYTLVEWMTWVGSDPFTMQVHSDDQELLGIHGEDYLRFRTVTCQDMCDRATLQRLHANPGRGPVSTKTWQRHRGPLLHEDALRILADEPLTRGPADYPVRLGRQLAWQIAGWWAAATSGNMPPPLVPR